MIDSTNILIVRKNIYISSLKALYIYLEQLTDAYVEAKSQLPVHKHDFLQSLEEQIEAITHIAEAFSASAAPPESDPRTVN